MSDNVSIGSISIGIKANSDEAGKSLDNLSGHIDKLKKTLKLVNFSAFIVGLKKIGQTIGSMVTQTTEYIDTLNLFKVTMGDSADEATKFINKAQELLGLDPSQMMNAMASFQNLANGFGIASDKASIMSQNLTQLSADMSAFLHIPIEQAMQKVKSGFAGELEPMRAVGVALDKATLQQTAYSLGINKKIDDMTRAQKTELIYYQMMTKTASMQGYMAKTAISPSQALRMLKSDFKQLAIAIGSIFIPIMMKIIPVVRAVTQILTEAAKKLASLFGFELADYTVDVSNIASSFGDVSDGISDVGSKAKKTKKEVDKMLMPFDELNNITLTKPDTDTSGTSGTGGIGAGGSLGIDTPSYDMFKGLNDQMNEATAKIKAKIEELKPLFIALGVVIATIWTVAKIAEFLIWLNKVKEALVGLKIPAALTKLAPVLTKIAGVLLIVAGAFVYLSGIFDILNPNVDFSTGLFKSLAGAAMIVLGVFLLFGGIPALITAIVLAIGIVAATIYRFRDNIKDFFTKTVPQWFKNAGKWLSELPGKIGYALGFMLGKVVKFFVQDVPNAIATFFTQTLPQWGENLKNFFTQTVPEKLGEFWNWLQTLPGKFVETGWNIITGIGQGIANAWNNFWQGVSDFIGNFVQGFKDALGINSPSTVFAEFGDWIIQGLINGITGLASKVGEVFNGIKDAMVGKVKEAKEKVVEFAGKIKEKAGEKWNDLKENTKEKFESVKTAISDKVGAAKDKAIEIAGNIKQGFSDKFGDAKTAVSDKFNDIKSNISDKMSTAKDKATEFAGNIKKGFTDKFGDSKTLVVDKFKDIKTNISDKMKDAKEKATGFAGDIKTNMTNKFKDAKTDAINKFRDIKEGIVGKIKDAKEKIKGIIDKIKGFFNFSWSLPKLKIPHLSWTSTPASGWISNVLSALNLPTSLPKLNISWYASGGFPEVGELFVANEAGPELVGNIGNKTAVANQGQITEGIAEATYSAFSRAFAENKTDANNVPYVNVYLGNDKLFSGYGKYQDRENNMYGVNVR